MSRPTLSRALIQDLDMFRSLPDAELDTILQHASAHRLLEGDAAFQHGEVAENFFVLLNGRLKVVQVTAEGEQIIVRHVNPGDIFGMAKAMRRDRYPASTIAVQESLALSWPAAAWDTMISNSPQFAAAAIQTVGNR